MAERVVGPLEPVEIQVKHREIVAAVDAGQRLGEPLAGQPAVGQVGERVVARHVRDPLLRPLAFGDVVMGGDPAAVGHRMVENRDGAAVRQLDQPRHGGAGRKRFEHSRHVLVDVDGETSGGLAVFEKLAQRATGLHHVAGEAVHPDIALVADHQPPLAVEHQERLRHVVDGGLEPQVLRLELGLALAQRLGANLEQPLQPAVERVELLDHQRDRTVGAAAVAVRLLVGRAGELAQFVEIDLARGAGRLGKLSGEKLVHGRYAASVMAVTVMVWLCSWQTPAAPCSKISPYE